MLRSPCSRISQRSLTIEWKHAKYLGEILDLFKEKKHQVMWSLYLPSTSGVKTYSHSKAVRASFTVAWINARAKAPRTAGERLVKPAAVKIAMVMCSDAVAQGGGCNQAALSGQMDIQPDWSTGHNCMCQALRVRQIAPTEDWQYSKPAFSVCLFD